MKRHGASSLPDRMLIRGDWGAESGYRAGIELAASGNFTGLFAANDQMALGALRAFNEAGVPAPTDISVVGYDDQPEGAYLAPPLTTATQEHPWSQTPSSLLDPQQPGRRPGSTPLEPRCAQA